MTSRRAPDYSAQLLRYLRSVVRSSARASRAAAAALRHENLMQIDRSPLRPFHEAQAAIHRESEARHLAAMALFRRQACLLGERVRSPRGLTVARPPRVIDTLVDVTGAAAVCVGLQTTRGVDALVASDSTARAAHDYEILFGEGPAHACHIEGPLFFEENDIRARWAQYASAITPLGVESVASVPLRAHDLTLGSMTAFGTSAQPIASSLPDLCTIGEAVVEVMVDEAADATDDDTDFIGDVDYRDTVHQATGMVSAQYPCSVGDALALLRAHAFVEGTDLESAAQAVIAGELRFEP